MFPVCSNIDWLSAHIKGRVTRHVVSQVKFGGTMGLTRCATDVTFSFHGVSRMPTEAPTSPKSIRGFGGLGRFRRFLKSYLAEPTLLFAPKSYVVRIFTA
jgi:hypothetical protein